MTPDEHLDRADQHLNAAERALARADAHLERAFTSTRWAARAGWLAVVAWAVAVGVALWPWIR